MKENQGEPKIGVKKNSTKQTTVFKENENHLAEGQLFVFTLFFPQRQDINVKSMEAILVYCDCNKHTTHKSVTALMKKLVQSDSGEKHH